MKTLTKKSLLALLSAGVISLALLGQQAHAVPITGQIGFAGLATFNTNSLATATRVTNFQPFAGGTNNSATVTNASGSFAGIAGGTLASFPNVYIFNPSSAVTPLWTVGGFTFNLTSSVINLQNSAFLDITGTGILTGPAGFDPTPGMWAFSSQSSGGVSNTNFSFSANTSALNVPEGGATVALLGAAVLGLVGLRRKFARS